MREIAWIRSARKTFESFPAAAQERFAFALALAALGQKADIAKPLRGLGPGVFEIALASRGDAFRVVYAVQFADAVWVVHAFQKKSHSGIATPRKEIDLIRERLKHLMEMRK